MSSILPDFMLGLLASIAIVLLSFGCWVGKRWMDQERIRKHVESTGGRVLSLKWRPFGYGWFGERVDRIYLVRYVTVDGCERECYCKTHLFGRIYTAEDRAVSSVEAVATKPPQPRRFPIKWFDME